MHYSRRGLTLSVRPPAAVGLLAVSAVVAFLLLVPAGTARADAASPQPDVQTHGTQASLSPVAGFPATPHSGDSADAGADSSAGAGVSSPGASDAGASDAGTPTPTPTRRPVAITVPRDGGVVDGASLPVSGTADPDARLTVRAAASRGDTTARTRTVRADTDGDWSTVFASLPGAPRTGPGWTVTATDADGGRASVSVGLLGSPVVSYSGDPNVVTGGTVSGSGAYPDATVAVASRALPGDHTCQVRADDDGTWTCSFGPPVHPPIGQGPRSTLVSVTQSIHWQSRKVVSAPGAYTVWFDRSPPAAPTLTTPASAVHITAGDSIHFAGTGSDGEDGTIVQIRTGSDATSAILCATRVRDGRWSCTGGGYLAQGRYRLTAVQLDEIGNTGAPSRSVEVTVDAAATSTPRPGTTPGAGTGHDPHGDATAPPASPRPHATTPPASPAAPADPHAGGGVTPEGSNLIGNTPLTATAAPSLALTAFPGWLRALLLAATALLLLAVPARLLASSLVGAGDAARASRPAVFGRNRSRAERQAAASPRSPAPAAAAVTVCAAVLAALAWPAPSTAAFLQLVVAALIAVVAVNGVWIAVGRRWGRRLTGGRPGLVVLPWMLALVAATSILSRVTGMQPALVFALLFALVPDESATARRRGAVALAQIGATAALGALAWLAATLAGDAVRLPSLAGDLLNAIAIAAIGSAAIALLPVGRMPGRAVFAWSRWVWLAAGLAVGTVLFALLVPVDSVWLSGSGWLLVIALGIGFAALSTAVWIWTRYIEPRL